MVTIFGIKNCDTVKKAKKWLDNNEISFQFHDFRVDGLSEKTLDNWLNKLGFDTLINKRSTTWKQLSKAQQESLKNGSNTQLILSQPTLIKRPVLEKNGQVYVGFKEQEYTTLFN